MRELMVLRRLQPNCRRNRQSQWRVDVRTVGSFRPPPALNWHGIAITPIEVQRPSLGFAGIHGIIGEWSSGSLTFSLGT
jgi:hypothetical protein